MKSKNEPQDENPAGAVGQRPQAAAPASRAPLAPLAKQNAPVPRLSAPSKSAQPPGLGNSAGPAACPTEPRLAPGGCGTTVATSTPARGAIQAVVKAEAQDDQALLDASFDTKVKAEPEVEAALQHVTGVKIEALRDEIWKTYDADVQCLADNARLRETIAQIQKRVDRLRAEEDCRAEQSRRSWQEFRAKLGRERRG